MQKLHPKAVWLFFVSMLIRAIIPVAFLGFIITGSIEVRRNPEADLAWSQFYWLWYVVPIVIVLAYIWAKLSYRFYHYELAEASFKKEEGVIWKRYTSIPYERIQNVDIYRGLLARILGLSDIHIQTAGMSTGPRFAEGRLPGLSLADAEALRNELIERSRRSRTGQGL